MHYRTPHAEALECLIEELITARNRGSPSRIRALVAAYLRTPYVWPMADTTHQLLLDLAGLPARDDRGAQVTAYLLGTGWTPIICTHTPADSDICVVTAAHRCADLHRVGERHARSGRLDALLNERARRHDQLTQRCGL